MSNEPPVISEALARRFADMAGAWVALDGDEIICAGDDLKAVKELAASMGHDDPLFYRVPGTLPQIHGHIHWRSD